MDDDEDDGTTISSCCSEGECVIIKHSQKIASELSKNCQTEMSADATDGFGSGRSNCDVFYGLEKVHA